MMADRSAGFTLIETLVAIALFSVLGAGFYAVMFSQVSGSERTRSVARITEEARLGFNRMVRDTREGSAIGAADGCVQADMQTGDCFNVKVDFDNDGIFENPNGDGDYENLTFSHNDDDDTIDITVCSATGCVTEVLIDGVEPSAAGDPVFSFSSNLLRYDVGTVPGATPGNGVTEWQELDAALGDVGNGNQDLDAGEWPYLTNVSFSFQISGEEAGERTQFNSEAQLRNLRFGG